MNILSLLLWPEGSFILHCMSLMVPYFTQSWTPHSFRGFVETCCHCLLACLNMLWLKTTAWGGKADGMWLDSVSGMQKLAGTFTSHNFSRAKGTYQNWDLHRTHRHPRLKLWSCSAVQILLNSISIFQFKVFQIHWVTPQLMHKPAQFLADGNKTVSILQHWQRTIKYGWTLSYVSYVSSDFFQMQWQPFRILQKIGCWRSASQIILLCTEWGPIISTLCRSSLTDHRIMES